MELKMRGWHCRYVEEYLAIGEAPDQIRNCFQQRSRWSKVRIRVCPRACTGVCAWVCTSGWTEKWLPAVVLLAYAVLQGQDVIPELRFWNVEFWVCCQL